MTRAPKTRGSTLAVLVLAGLFAAMFAACASTDYGRKTENLDKSLRVYNLQFESKMIDNLLPLVHKDEREAFALGSLDFREKVTIYESTRIDLRYFKDDEEITPASDDFEEEFNKIVAKIRYRFVTSPSTQVRTAIVEQEWVYEGDNWYVKPRLDQFLK